MSRVSVTTLSRWTSVDSGVILATGASGIDATTSVSLFGRTKLNGLYRSSAVRSRCQCLLVLSDTFVESLYDDGLHAGLGAGPNYCQSHMFWWTHGY